MTSKTNDIFKEISRLIFLVENSKIEKIDKLKIVKVLFVVKLKLFELLKKEIETEAKISHEAKAPLNGQPARDSERHKLILHFIRNNGGRVDSIQLSGLGIASRSLRRYIKDLRDANKIRIERSGRNLFYLMV